MVLATDEWSHGLSLEVGSYKTNVISMFMLNGSLTHDDTEMGPYTISM